MTLLPYKELSFVNPGSKEAGEKLSALMSLGSSEPWQVALEKLTGERRLNPGPLLEYFRPLQEWLAEENRKNGVTVGWSVEDFEDLCVSDSEYEYVDDEEEEE